MRYPAERTASTAVAVSSLAVEAGAVGTAGDRENSTVPSSTSSTSARTRGPRPAAPSSGARVRATAAGAGRGAPAEPGEGPWRRAGRTECRGRRRRGGRGRVAADGVGDREGAEPGGDGKHDDQRGQPGDRQAEATHDASD